MTRIALLRAGKRLLSRTLSHGPEEGLRFVDAPLSGLEPLRLAWEHLGAVRSLDEETARALRLILTETLPDAREPAPSRALELPEPRRGRRPTAAHPRAYRGTHTQPPQSGSRLRLDLRPWLDDPVSQARLRKRLGLESAGSLYMAAHHGVCASMRALELPGPFVRDLLGPLCGLPWSDVAELLSLYWQLGWHHNAEERARVAHLLVAEVPSGVIRGLRGLAGLSAAERGVVLEALRERPAVVSEVAFPEDGWARVSSSCVDPERFPKRVRQTSEAICVGACPETVLRGIELLEMWAPAMRLPMLDAYAHTWRAFPLAFLEERLGRWLEEDTLFAWNVGAVWRMWGSLEGLEAFVAELVSLPASVEKAAFYALESLARAPDARWSALSGRGAIWREHLQSCRRPEVWCEVMARAVEAWEDEPETFAGSIEAVEAVAHRVAGAGSLRTRGIDALLRLMKPLSPELRERVLQAPESSFKALRKGCGKAGDTQCISWATRRLAEHLPELAVEAFARAPGLLMRVLKPLGAMSLPLQSETLQRAMQHPLMAPLGACDDFEKRVCDFDVWCGDALTFPLPAKARRDPGALKPGQRARAWAVAKERVVLTRLEVVEREVWATLRQGLDAPLDDEGARYALMLLHEIQRNRRGLRRLLKHTWAGKTGGIEGHPVSQSWLERLPERAREIWLSDAPLLEREGVRWSFEHETLEALRLGSYVGTCLGVGGLCSYSSAAVVLDVNKNVIYARDAKGHVLARQVVAVDAKHRLVCFEIYPESARDALASGFLEVDRVIVERTGLERYDGDVHDDYTVEVLLAEGWWDDGAWEAKEC